MYSNCTKLASLKTINCTKPALLKLAIYKAVLNPKSVDILYNHATSNK